MVFKCFNCRAKFSLHCIPRSPLIFNKWKQVIPNINEATFNKSFKLCSAHFDKKYVVNERLLWNAVPTKFLSADGVWYKCEVPDDSVFTIEQIKTEDQNDFSSDIDESIRLLKERALYNNVATFSLDKNVNIPSTSSSTICTSSSFSTSCVNQNSNEITPPRSTVSNRNLIRYSGDVNCDVTYTPRSAKKAIQVCKEEIVKLRRDKKLLQRKMNRMKVKIENLQNILKDLQKKDIISSSSRQNLNLKI